MGLEVAATTRWHLVGTFGCLQRYSLTSRVSPSPANPVIVAGVVGTLFAAACMKGEAEFIYNGLGPSNLDACSALVGSTEQAQVYQQRRSPLGHFWEAFPRRIPT